MRENSKVLVCGGTGLVGSAIVRKLLEKGYASIMATHYSKDPSTVFA
ncbi:MAG: GDP-L-fucose synthase, partial [Aquificota bacterium]